MVFDQQGARSVRFDPGPGLNTFTQELSRTGATVSVPALGADDRAGVLFASWIESGEPPISDETQRFLPSAGVAASPISSPKQIMMSVSRDRGLSWSRAIPMNYEIPLRAGRLEPGDADSAEPPAPAGLRAASGDNLYIVQWLTPGLQAWRDRLAQLGAEVLNPLPGHAHVVRMSATVAALVRLEPFVRWIGPYQPAWRLDPEIIAAFLARTGGEEDLPHPFVLQTFAPGPAEKATLASEVAAAGGRVTVMIPDGYLLEADLTLEQAVRLAHSNHLLWLEPQGGPPGTDMDLVRIQSGADYIEGLAGYSGQGLSAEVFDDGIQTSPFHQDHDGIQIHGPGPSTSSHGTSTYGIVFGNGDRDGDGQAKATGMLPSATGWFSDYSSLTNRYTHTSELVQSPIFASFQSNSWGNTQTTLYTTKSFEMDDIIWTYDIPIFQSQSNQHGQSSRPEAWAKNVISIGAVDHFDTLSLADDCWCNTASIGPAADGRIKPDLIYWYDLIWTTTTPATGYTNFAGTSASTPAAAGIGGLMLQMWADDLWGTAPPGISVFDKRPHSSTTKALLINTAEGYSFSGTTADLTRTHQGWGLPSVKRAWDRAPLTKIVDESDVLIEFGRTTWTAAVPAGQSEMRVTMDYQDRAGTTSASLHRINDVSLRVTAPNGTQYWGNTGLDVGQWSVAGGAADTKNTVENVFLQNPAAGDWMIEIFADDINQDVHAETGAVDQDYALVVYPATLLTNCTSGVPAPTGVTASVPPAADHAIRVNWTPAGVPFEQRIYRSDGSCAGPFTFIGTVGGTASAFLDTAASGGRTYGYVVRSYAGCESVDSACASATAVGNCAIGPSFAGASAVASADANTCGVAVSWGTATAAGLPVCTGPVVYNVYRGSASGFTPGAANRIAACLTGTSFLDTSGLAQGQSYGYIVRAEDLAGAGGPCGGVEDGNAAVLSDAPYGPATTLLASDFESGLNGWVPAKGVPAATTGDFISGDPTGTLNGTTIQAQPEDDHTPGAGVRCLYTASNSGFNISIDDVDNGEVLATSSVFNAAAFVNARVSYWRWHYLQDLNIDPADFFAVEYSKTNGSSWTSLEMLDNSVSANRWIESKFSLPPAQLATQMKLRVRSADGVNAATIVESAIDDVLVQGLAACSTKSGPPGVISGAPLALVAEKVGASVRLTWGADCGASTKFGVYRGDLALGWTSVAPVAGQCNLTARTLDLPLDTGSYFYLVAPNNGASQGSMGTTSSGARRAAPPSACFPTASTLDACAP